MAMLGNFVVMLKNVVIALGGKMTIMETLFVDWGSQHSFGPIGQLTTKIHNKFILCPKHKISVTSFNSHSCLCMRKKNLRIILLMATEQPTHFACRRQLYLS